MHRDKLQSGLLCILPIFKCLFKAAQNSFSSRCSHVPEQGEEWEQLQVAVAPGVETGDIQGSRASFVMLTAMIRVSTWLNWVLTSRKKIPLGITASQHGTIVGLTSFSVYITSSSCLRCMNQYLLDSHVFLRKSLCLTLFILSFAVSFSVRGALLWQFLSHVETVVFLTQNTIHFKSLVGKIYF